MHLRLWEGVGISAYQALHSLIKVDFVLMRWIILVLIHVSLCSVQRRVQLSYGRVLKLLPRSTPFLTIDTCKGKKKIFLCVLVSHVQAAEKLRITASELTRLQIADGVIPVMKFSENSTFNSSIWWLIFVAGCKLFCIVCFLLVTQYVPNNFIYSFILLPTCGWIQIVWKRWCHSL